MIGVTFDMEKAYDNVWHRYILQSPTEINTEGSVFSNIKNFLKMELSESKVTDVYRMNNKKKTASYKE